MVFLKILRWKGGYAHFLYFGACGGGGFSVSSFFDNLPDYLIQVGAVITILSKY